MEISEVQPLTVKDIHIVENKDLKKVIIAAGLGNAVEWFDFGIYGFLVVILGRVFFQDLDPSMQLIASFATFSIPFIFRPLGGLIFGSLGDKYGRKSILAFTIILMTVSTTCIGLLPSYAAIGITAPILLLIIKIIQGLSVGGEYSGAVIFVGEYSPDRKRGFMASWLDFGSIAGFLFGALVVFIITAMVGQDAMYDWGWRIPFLLSLPLGIIGLYLRQHLDETPAYQAQLAAETEHDTSSLKDIVSVNWRNIIICCGLVIVTNTTYYMILTYMPSYLSVNLHYSESNGVFIIIVVMIFMLFMQPLVGLFSDKIGRRPFLIAGASILLFLSIPAFWLIIQGHPWMTFIGIAILAVALCCFTGVMASILAALFPTEVRFRALALSFNISVLIAGLAPPIAAALVEKTGSLYLPAFYLMSVAALSMGFALFMRETANRPLKGSLPVASSRKEAKEVLEEHFDYIEDRVTALDERISELEEKRQGLVDQHPRLN